MKTQDDDNESISALRVDLMTANVLVWVVRVGRDAELTPDAHRYFFDRYRRLAAYHRRRGHEARAQRLQAKIAAMTPAELAAAIGMPRPRTWLATDAVSRHHLRGPDDAA